MGLVHVSAVMCGYKCITLSCLHTIAFSMSCLDTNASIEFVVLGCKCISWSCLDTNALSLSCLNTNALSSVVLF